MSHAVQLCRAHATITGGAFTSPTRGSTNTVPRPTPKTMPPQGDPLLPPPTQRSNGLTPLPVLVQNPTGRFRVISTKPLPGTRWIDALVEADCRVEICTAPKTILSPADITALIGDRCDGAIGQLTEDWSGELFAALRRAGGRAYSNMADGFNNVDLAAATRYGIPVGNTPGIASETTAELAVALTLATARRVVEADHFMRDGKYDGWLPTRFIGNPLKGRTLGILGAGRIGTAYARMMMEGHKMNVMYYDLYQAKKLESFTAVYSSFLESLGEAPLTCTRAGSVEEVLTQADVISLHVILDDSTRHLINMERLELMKKDAILINISRGPVIDESALVEHLKANPLFHAGLDVFEEEPKMQPGLESLANAIVVPHIASALMFTRAGMATLAACNVAGALQGFPVWPHHDDVMPFLDETASSLPQACPSIVNAKELGLAVMGTVNGSAK
ncbi:hydroxypyruvate reductase 1 [Klebsormidium nitens]|uniref:Hydroxypyruvate reductase 1 n=1 Tax=Klebsormidium nitens TaxID=105231 RepID=A0A1Y1I2N3_KLENI|nr:hydroxypyruvate reductase 1 [Klebsormidium nitens]|eukprot:GAQ83689.1 hydroxypyruvate reductase 1 [Klebsormidium nitens]